MVWSHQEPRTLVLGVFENVQHAASIIDRLLDAKLQPSALTLLMSDRTATRHFAPGGPSDEPGTERPCSKGVRRLIEALAPIAPLGTPGTGLVATGLLPAALITAGVGTAGGLEHGLTQLGITRAVAEEVARRVAGGDVLVGARFEDADVATQKKARLIEHEAALAFQLQVAHTPSGTRLVCRPSGPITAQSGSYEPVVQPEDTAR